MCMIPPSSLLQLVFHLFIINHSLIIQVLPHDLATQLRTVLLDTPSSVSEEDKEKQEEEEKFELFYWENSAKNTTDNPGQIIDPPVNTHHQPFQPIPPPSSHGDPSMISQQSLPPHMTRGGVSPYQSPFEATRSVSSSPSQLDSSHFIRGHNLRELGGEVTTPPLQPDHRQTHFAAGSKNISGQRLSPDPRLDTRDPRQSSQQDPRPYNRDLPPPAVETNTYSHSDTTSNSYPVSKSHSYSSPHSNVSSMKPSNPFMTSSYTIPKTTSRESPPFIIPPSSWQNTNNDSIDRLSNKSSERLIDPRKKYSQFKIKPKSSVPASDDRAVGTLSSSEPLPELLRDRSILNKPIDPKDLFSGYPGGISLFGSANQLESEPVGEGGGGGGGGGSSYHEYGEIKMRRDSVQQEQDEVTSNSKEARENDEAPAIIPSYLTDLISQSEEGNSIDSAFGSLQSRKRRLSELTPSTPTVSDKNTSNQSSNRDDTEEPSMRPSLL